jgi:putative membrane protein
MKALQKLPTKLGIASIGRCCLLWAASSITSDDSDFLKSAAKGGIAEVELGKIAAEKASNTDVKEFANRMVREHTKANADLHKLAASKGVDLPSSKSLSDEASFVHLKMLSGHDFDNAYVKMMVDDHQEDVAAFEKAAIGSTDADVKKFAARTLPTLKHHLSLIEDIQSNLNAK